MSKHTASATWCGFSMPFEWRVALAMAVAAILPLTSVHAALAELRAKRLDPRGTGFTWQEMTVVIANGNVPESVRLAQEYMERRGISKDNYLELRCSTAEEISREEFERDIWNPLTKWAFDKEYLIQVEDPKNHPWGMDSPYISGILWFVLTYGMPLKIAEHYGPGESGWRAPMERNAASVDSELATWPKGPGALAGPIPNPMYRPGEDWAWGLIEPRNDVQTLVARLDGPTYEIARDLMNRCDYKEQFGMGGRQFVDTMGLKEGVRLPFDELLLKAVRWMEIDGGMKVIVDRNLETFPADTPMPTPSVYLGWSAPHITGPFVKPGFKFWPGAVAIHFHPWSAASLRTTERFWVGPLLARGAGLVIGDVFDPGLDGYIRPHVLMRSLTSVQRGQRAMDVVWSCVPYLSWSTVFIGEPTYAPFSGTLPMLERLYKAGATGEKDFYEGADLPLRVRRWRNLTHPTDTVPISQIKDIIEQYGWEHPDFLEFLANLWSTRELLSPSVAYHTYERAAELSPYPAQRSRVRLAAARLVLSLADDARMVYELGRIDPLFKEFTMAQLAKRQLEKAVEQDPRERATAEAYNLLAKLYGEEGDEEKQRETLQLLIENLPDTIEGRNAAGELWVLDRAKTNPVPTVFAARLEAAPTLDGKADDPCWRAATSGMPALMKELGPGFVPAPIELSAAYDTENVYFFVKCPFNMLTESELLGRREIPDRERVELLFSPRRDYRTAYSLSIARGGGIQAIRDDGAAWAFNRNWVVSHHDGVGNWTVEIAIPLAEFGTPKAGPGAVWGMNFRRQRQLQDVDRLDRITTSWLGRYGDVDEVSQFGYLAFE